MRIEPIFSDYCNVCAPIVSQPTLTNEIREEELKDVLLKKIYDKILGRKCPDFSFHQDVL